jgi:hypothetical protein
VWALRRLAAPEYSERLEAHHASSETDAEVRAEWGAEAH